MVVDGYGWLWMVMDGYGIYGYIRHFVYFVACDAAFGSGRAECETNTFPSGSHDPIFLLPVLFLPCGSLGVALLGRRHHLPCARSRAPCHTLPSYDFPYLCNHVQSCAIMCSYYQLDTYIYNRLHIFTTEQNIQNGKLPSHAISTKWFKMMDFSK